MSECRFDCPQCGKPVAVDEALKGAVVVCPYCDKGIVVPKNAMRMETVGLATGKAFGRFRPGCHSLPNENARKPHVAIPRRFVFSERSVGASQDESSLQNGRKGGKWRVFVRFLLVAVGMAFVLGGASYGGYLHWGEKPRLERGVAHYNAKRYDKAFALFKPLAEKGVASAEFHFGECYAHGNGTGVDMETAVKWYRRAAEQKLPEAQFRLFEFYRDGKGVDCNVENAARWCRKAAEAGFVKAMLAMGGLYAEGKGVEKDGQSALRWFRRGAEHDYPPALYALGECHRLGAGVRKDVDKGIELQNKAMDKARTMADRGDVDAMVFLAGVELDAEESVRWLRKAAEQGNCVAQFSLSLCYKTGAGVEVDETESAKWLLKAAEQGGGEVQYAMGCYYRDGIGVERDLPEAVRWFARSSKKGSANGLYALALCHLRGHGVTKDEVKGEKLLVSAMDAGSEDAKTELRRIKDKRAEQERRIAMEKAEQERRVAMERGERERRIAAERTEKLLRIENMGGLEAEISNLKKCINSILKGERRDDEWNGFNAAKIALMDGTVSVKEEKSVGTISTAFSEKSAIADMEKALATLNEEKMRLQSRLETIVKVKEKYDLKELEARKECCAICSGTGLRKCGKCKGSGKITVSADEPCPICGEKQGSADDILISESSGRVKTEAKCSRCGGRGKVKVKCAGCGGRGKWHGRGFSLLRCGNCGGSGYCDAEDCPKCHGSGKMEVWRKWTCDGCGGKGVVQKRENLNCTDCAGRGKVKCVSCDGHGFTYRAKESD